MFRLKHRNVKYDETNFMICDIISNLHALEIEIEFLCKLYYIGIAIRQLKKKILLILL